jgi:hypothetical protein
MNSLLDSSPSIRQTLRYVEWILIALYLLTNIFDVSFGNSPEIALRSTFILCSFALMSFAFPNERAYWQK